MKSRKIAFEEKCRVFVLGKYYEAKALETNLKWRIATVILQKKGKLGVHIKTFLN